MPNPTFVTFESAAASAESILSDLQKFGLADRSSKGLVLPGGRSALPLFEKLRDRNRLLSEFQITVSDERAVTCHDPRSNIGQLRRYLGALQTIAWFDDPPQQVVDAGQVKSINARLSTFPWGQTFAVLGMGTDGHIASLFPETPASDRFSEQAIIATTSPIPPHERYSLTLSRLSCLAKIVLLAPGAAKHRALETARGGAATPVADLLGHARALQVHLFPEP